MRYKKMRNFTLSLYYQRILIYMIAYLRMKSILYNPFPIYKFRENDTRIYCCYLQGQHIY